MATKRSDIPICIMTSELCLRRECVRRSKSVNVGHVHHLSWGLVSEMRKRNNSRIQGSPYGSGSENPSKVGDESLTCTK